MSDPVGYASASGATHPASRSSSAATGSTLYSHGENTRTWPHSRMLAPTASPASNTSGSIPRDARWAAAASPTGPAPMTATTCGFSIMSESSRESRHRNFSMRGS